MMLQEIYPNKLNNQYDPSATPSSEDYVLLIKDNDICIKMKDEPGFPRISDLLEAIVKEEIQEFIYLFSIDNEKFFMPSDYSGEELSTYFHNADVFYEYKNLRSVRESGVLPKKYIFAAYTAKHLYTWYSNNQYCGRCGASLIHSDTERAMCCPDCNNTIYPKIMPAVIVGVINKDKILITRYRRGYNHNALIAGFTEIGETLEETVAREVMEEAGLKVKNIRYYKSQPWGIAADILTGFFCEVDGDDSIHMDEGELKFAEWLARDEIELQPDGYSLTNEMMKRFKDGLE